VVDHVGPVGGQEAVVERHHHGADLWYAVEPLEVRVRVGSDVRDAVAGRDAEALQGARPAIAPVEKLGVAPPLVPVDHGLTVAVQ